MNTIKLISSHGLIVADAESGLVLTCVLSDEWTDSLPEPELIDTLEWKRRYPGEEPEGEHDILDFGYWYYDPKNQQVVYEPPSEAWRREREQAIADAIAEAKAENNGGWEQIPDANVRTAWRCHNCKIGVTGTLPSLADGGLPICFTCGEDMEYVRTEIRKP